MIAIYKNKVNARRVRQAAPLTVATLKTILVDSSITSARFGVGRLVLVAEDHQRRYEVHFDDADVVALLTQLLTYPLASDIVARVRERIERPVRKEVA